MGLIGAFFVVVCLYYGDYVYRGYRMIVTLSRPLWDVDPLARVDLIYNFGWSQDPFVSCPLHRMTPLSQDGRKSRVFDVILASNQFELLEVRLAELDPVVEKFIIFESPCYFNGEMKASFLDLDLPTIRRFKSKIVHIILNQGDLCSYTDDALEGDRALRREIRRPMHYDRVGLEKGDLVVFADLDEIPRRSTIELLRSCAWPAGVDRINLQLMNYMFSFEFPKGDSVVPTAVIRFTGRNHVDFYHGIPKQNPVALAQAGWHCTWCFKSINEIIAKMKGYGHK